MKSTEKFIHKKIFLAGHRGMVGSAIKRNLEHNGYNHLITRSQAELDLIKQNEVDNFFSKEKPECVIIAAAKV
ncbi:MAG TPA: NAD-dependent epimerase/dehydratase family protein, partial [Ignavibacteriaceae bacterium]|nr:NAD-dependent epimerase/dehydratase family protein [Ignavibacteriaceae bacterium]